MKTRHSQLGESLLGCLFQLVLLVVSIFFILFILYACGKSSGQSSLNRVQQSQTSYVKNISPSVPIVPSQLPPPAVNIGVPPNANAAAQASSASGGTTSGEIVIARQMMPRTQLQPAPPLPNAEAVPEPDVTVKTSLPKVSQVSQFKTPRIGQTVVRQKDSVGRMIIIATVIALAVIIFWFVHSNVMYKRTLRAVAAEKERREEGEENALQATEAAQQQAQASPPAAPQVEPAAVTEQAPGDPVATSAASESVSQQNQQSSVVDRLVWLKHLYDNGLISQADYEAKKKEILTYI